MNNNIYNIIKKMQAVVAIVVLCATLSGCIQSEAATRFTYSKDPAVSESAVKLVNTVFHTTFLGGDWFYQGAQATNGTINAYIQIPNKLEMDEKMQKQYLKMAICPAKTKTALWKSLKEIPLSVHIYTSNKKFTVFAHCENPYSRV